MLASLLGGETFPVLSLLGTAFVLTGVWLIFHRTEAPNRRPQQCEAKHGFAVTVA